MTQSFHLTRTVIIRSGTEFSSKAYKAQSPSLPALDRWEQTLWTPKLCVEQTVPICPGLYQDNEVSDNPKTSRAKACPGQFGHLEARWQVRLCQHCGSEYLCCPCLLVTPVGAGALEAAEPCKQGAVPVTATSASQGLTPVQPHSHVAGLFGVLEVHD